MIQNQASQIQPDSRPKASLERFTSASLAACRHCGRYSEVQEKKGGRVVTSFITSHDGKCIGRLGERGVENRAGRPPVDRKLQTGPR